MVLLHPAHCLPDQRQSRSVGTALELADHRDDALGGCAQPEGGEDSVGQGVDADEQDDVGAAVAD